jgi:hypothetical protein
MANLNAVCTNTGKHQPRVLAVLTRNAGSNWGADVASQEAEGYCHPSGTSGAPTWTSYCPHCGTTKVLAAATLATRADAALTGRTGFHTVDVEVTN